MGLAVLYIMYRYLSISCFFVYSVTNWNVCSTNKYLTNVIVF